MTGSPADRVQAGALPRPVQIPDPTGKYTARSRDRGRGRHRPARDRLL